VSPKECGHSLIAGEIAAPGLILTFLDGSARIPVKWHRLITASGNSQQHFGHFVLLGLRQLANLLDCIVEQFRHV